MKYIITSFLLLSTLNLFPQTDLGIGIVSINFDSNTKLDFYKDTTDQSPGKTLQFFNDPKINSWNICYLEQHKDWLLPESLWLDYHSFDFRVVEKKTDWFRIIVNNGNGNTMWLKQSDETDFQNWEEFLKEMFSISRLPEVDQKILEWPKDGAAEIPYIGEDCFQIRTMRGDWVEIFSPKHCDSYTDNATGFKSGWIRWRNGNQLIIEYFKTS